GHPRGRPLRPHSGSLAERPAAGRGHRRDGEPLLRGARARHPRLAGRGTGGGKHVMTTEHPLTAIVGDITAVEADAIVNVTNDAYLTRWAISGRNPVHRWSSGLRILCAAVTSPAPAVLVCALWCDGTVQWWLRPL